MKGEGNQQDYEMRVYDGRLGKFLSVDPLTKSYPWNSTYAFAENDVLRNIDLDGGEKLQKTNCFVSLQYKPVFRTPNVLTAASNAAHNGIAMAWNLTLGGAWDLGGHVQNFTADLIDGKYNNLDPLWEFNEWQNDVVRYHTNTPVKQQAQDFANVATDLRNYELPLGLFLGGLASKSNAGLPALEGVGSNPYIPLQKVTLKESTLSTDGRLGGYIFNGVTESGGAPVKLHGTFDFIVNDNVLSFGKRHTFLSTGAKNVEAAGTLTFKGGILTNVDNLSGHYFPSINETGNYLTILQKHGLDVSKSYLKIYNTHATSGNVQLYKQVAPNAKARSAYTLSL